METFIRNHIPVEIITNGIDGILNKPVVFEGGSDGAYVEKCLKRWQQSILIKRQRD